MNEQQSIWAGFPGSFRPDFYRGIVTQPFGRSFVYFVLLILAVSILFSIKYTITARTLIGEAVTWVNTEFVERLPEFLPEININDGEVSSPVEQPFIHRWGDFAFVLDTTGTFASLEEYRNCVLITKRSIIVRTIENGNIKTQEHDLSKVKSLGIGPGREAGELVTFRYQDRKLSVTREHVSRWSRAAGWTIIPFVVVLVYFYHLFVKFFHLLIFSLVSLLANRIMDAGLEYNHLLNIGIFALTPPARLGVLAALLDIDVPRFWLLYSLVYCAFLIMAIKQCRISSVEGEIILETEERNPEP